MSENVNQIDIFGNISNIEPVTSKGKPKQIKTIKGKFRLVYGEKEGYHCKDCKQFNKHTANQKYYYKCILMGISSGSGTDIRLKDVACLKYEEREENET